MSHKILLVSSSSRISLRKHLFSSITLPGVPTRYLSSIWVPRTHRRKDSLPIPSCPPIFTQASVRYAYSSKRFKAKQVARYLASSETRRDINTLSHTHNTAAINSRRFTRHSTQVPLPPGKVTPTADGPPSTPDSRRDCRAECTNRASTRHPRRSATPGVILALRNLTADEHINRGNRLHPYYLVYLDDQGEVIANQTEAKHLLDLLRVGCRPYEEPVTEVVGVFNAPTG